MVSKGAVRPASELGAGDETFQKRVHGHWPGNGGAVRP
jgi:hypothetical protein